MDIFVGRNKELKRLSHLQERSKASCVVLRGRRRIGKSYLVEHFAKNKNFIRFSGLAPDVNITAEQQRENIAFQISNHFKIVPPNSKDWSYIFASLEEHFESKKTILLFDEISWMASGDLTFLPKLKIFWDDVLSKKSNFIFIMCGSVSSWIDKNILSSTGFFGRINETITLTELNLQDSTELLRLTGFRGSNFEKMLIFCLTGGIPWYIEQFNNQGSAISQIHHLAFSSEGLFVNEYNRIFTDLFGRRSSAYKAIVETLLGGPKSYQELLSEINYSSSGTFSEYLADLEVSGFVSCDKTWSLKTGKLRNIAQYRLKDNYLRFYVKLILPNLDKISQGRFEADSILKFREFYTFMGLQFENIVLLNRSRIIEELGVRPSEILSDNPFVQRHTKKLKGCQVDYLIQTELKSLYIIEVKLTQNVIGLDVIDEVKDKLDKLEIPKGYSCLPVLIHFGNLSEELAQSSFFYKVIDFSALMSS